ncbi:hypothetical protein B484DRAFT_224992 [Ochromonadaceae sp. CCMP2298]|nr:hypothetical protein B484DRAFT_224992 [Ochromonadaceae sp. CCMP2298]
MFENNQDDLKKVYPTAAYVQRSASVPLMAENAPEADNPSRANPRQPVKKGADLFTGMLSLIAEPPLSVSPDVDLDNTPMGLIQADFPSTPSSLYASSVVDEAPAADTAAPVPAANGDAATPPAAVVAAEVSPSASKVPFTAAAKPGADVDSATKSLARLYVSPDSLLSSAGLGMGMDAMGGMGMGGIGMGMGMGMGMGGMGGMGGAMWVCQL